MTAPLHIDENTYREIAETFCPGHGHSKLARSLVEFVVQSIHGDGSSVELVSLKDFVDFLIKNKGYN